MSGDYAEAAAWALLAILLALIAAEDLKSQRIPNTLNAALLLGGLAAAACTPTPGLVSSALGAALGFGLPFAVAVAYRRFRGTDGLGLGDVKFLAGAGAWTGWQGVGPTVFIAATTALLLLGVRRLAGGRWDRGKPLPFGPHLCLALLLVRAFQPGE